MRKNKGNILITVISNVISVVVALIISFFVTQYIVANIGKEAYSFYPIANNFTTYFSAIFLITNSLSSRFIMIPYLRRNYEDASKYCSTILFSNIIITFVIFLIESIFFLNINSIINIPKYLLSEVKELFIYTLMTSIIYGLCSYFTVGYYVKERMDLQAISSIAENVIKGFIVLYLLLNDKITIASFGASMFISACTRSFLDVCFYYYLMRDIPIKISSFSKNSLIEITKLGIWSLISQSGTLLISNVQLIISNKFLGVENGSELALVQPLIVTCSLIAYTVSRFLDPTITRNISNYSKESKTSLKYIYIVIEICVVAPIAVILSISGSFYKLWIPNEYTNTLLILTILSCVEYIIMYLSLVNNSILTTFFKVKEKAIAYLLSGAFNLILIFLFLSFTNLGNIAILLSAIITYSLYHLVFISKYTKHVLKDNQIDIPYLSIKDYFLYILIMIINLVIVSFVNIKGYLLLILICVSLFIFDVLFISIVKKIKIKEFVAFLTKSNN